MYYRESKKKNINVIQGSSKVMQLHGHYVLIQNKHGFEFIRTRILTFTKNGNKAVNFKIIRMGNNHTSFLIGTFIGFLVVVSGKHKRNIKNTTQMY